MMLTAGWMTDCLPLASRWVPLLAQADAGAYHYHRPFVQPLPAWDYWYLLLLPLCAGVAVVYKCIKCRSMKAVPRESAVIFGMIVGGMLLAAVLLGVLVRLIER